MIQDELAEILSLMYPNGLPESPTGKAIEANLERKKVLDSTSSPNSDLL